MSGSVSLNLTTDEIKGLNANVESLKTTIAGYLTSIYNNAFSLQNEGIMTQDISSLIGEIATEINNIKGSFSARMDSLITFLKKQMELYEITEEEAEKDLLEAFEFIKRTFSNYKNITN